MSSNLPAILAGQAFVRYYAENDEFKRGNREAEKDFRDTRERMRTDQDRYDRQAFFKERDRLDALRKMRDRAREVEERADDAYYRRQQRKQEERRRKEERDQREYISRNRAMRDLAIGGTVFGSRLSGMGSQALGGLLGTVQEYAGVEAAILSARVNLSANGGGLSSQMRMLQKAAYDIGVKTEYDAKEVAQMMERMSISRLSEDQIAKYSTPIINVASVFSNGLHGKMNPSVASRAVMEMMNAMEYSADRIPEIADKLAVAGRRADVTLENLADAFRYAGGSAIEAGMNFDQILAALIVLDKRGLKGEMGGTALRGITASVLDPTDEASKEYAAYGINLPRKGKLNLEALIRQFERKIGHLSPVEQAAVIAKAFPNRQMTGVQMLVGAADQMATETAALAGSAGMGDRYASSKRQGVGFSLDVVHSAWQSAKANLGETYKDETNWAARKLAGAIESGGEFLQANPGVGKAVAYGAGVATAIGKIGGGASSLMGAYYGTKILNAGLATLGTSIGGLTASVTKLGLSAVAGAGKLAAAGVSAAAWPAAVAAGVAAVGVAIDQTFNKGRATKWYSSRFNDVAAYFDGRWDQSDSVAYEGENVVTREQFTPKTNTFLRNDRGEIIGELDAKTGERRMFEIRDRFPHFMKYKRYPVRNGKLMDPFTGEEVDQKNGRNLRDGQYLWDRISAGMDLKDRMGSSITGAIASGVKTGRDWLGVGQAYARQNFDADWKKKESDRSPENPENRKAWIEFAKANPIVPGFEQESERARADQWYSFLSNFRMQQLLKKGQPTAERVLNNLGDYELRSQTGQNYLIELLTQKKKPADGQTIDDKLLEEAKKTNKILEGKDMVGHKLGGGR